MYIKSFLFFIGAVLFSSEIFRHIFFNVFEKNDYIKTPNAVFSCSEHDLVSNVTIVVSIKDTCSQGFQFLTHLSHMIPKNMNIIYTYPDFIGCNLIVTKPYIFKNIKIIRINRDSTPIDGFLRAQPFIKTPYALLLHNDCYMMHKQTLCEMYKSLEIHPEAEFAAPQIFERSSDKIIVPHGHHTNLHIFRINETINMISYDIDLELASRRRPIDFEKKEGPQMNFMEDHAYMGRTNTFHLYLDTNASQTMEYIDNILAMRMNNTYPWYVPTAHFMFDVNHFNMGWKDLPYFANKRSDYVGVSTRNYLTNKWKINFPYTGIWNYVKYTMIDDYTLTANELPYESYYKKVLFYTWFQIIGFNKFNGKLFIDFIHDKNFIHEDLVTVERSLDIPLVKVSRTYNKSIYELLPFVDTVKNFEVSLNTEFFPIDFTIFDDCKYDSIGMITVDEKGCHRYVYNLPFIRYKKNIIEKLLRFIKVPSRVLKFAEMKNNMKNDSDFLCKKNQYCKTIVKYHGDLIKWNVY